ncbi:Predicted metal-dependent peptidase [Armatimonadetes bacterium DC]|nr:VWA-like domain-containing protein [Armatimonadota bacterium]CUU36131.1 Predicted metal-dependent peptidase [Armatimonadetes bacterium DC]
MSHLPIEEWVRAARVYAAEQAAWFAPALYAAPFRLSEQLPAPAAIDRHGRVYFNPHWVARIYEQVGQNRQRLVQQLGFLWYHEVMHWLRQHEARAADIRAVPEVWNLACDMEINDYLPDGLAYPEFGGAFRAVFPRDYGLEEGHTAEWYYRRLLEQQEQQRQQRGESDAGEQEQEQQAGGGSAGEQEKQEQAGGGSSGEQEKDEQQAGGVGAGEQDMECGSSASAVQRGGWDEGSGVHGQPRPWELPAESEEAPALSEFDRQALRETVAHNIIEHQKNRGTLPAGLVRWAEEVLKPKVNWREQLKRVVRGAISEGFGQRLDYSLRRPNRRLSVYHPLYLPSLQGEYRPRVACVVDTSGSISDRELTQALAEVRAVLEQLRVPITIIPCDAVPYEAIQVMRGSDWLKVREGLRGGGGTDMVAGLQAALELTPKPDAVIVLTDGYTPFPTERPKDTVVIWALWQYGDAEPPLPPMPPWQKRDVVVIPIQ